MRSLNPSVPFQEEVDLIFNPKVFYTFIQTDKPFYKPGESMKFRVIVMNSDTRPVSNLSYIEIVLRDSEDYTVQEWPYAKLQNGVFEYSIHLPTLSNQGLWKLIVESTEVSLFFSYTQKQITSLFWL